MTDLNRVIAEIDRLFSTFFSTFFPRIWSIRGKIRKQPLFHEFISTNLFQIFFHEFFPRIYEHLYYHEYLHINQVITIESKLIIMYLYDGTSRH